MPGFLDIGLPRFGCRAVGNTGHIIITTTAIRTGIMVGTRTAGVIGVATMTMVGMRTMTAGGMVTTTVVGTIAGKAHRKDC